MIRLDLYCPGCDAELRDQLVNYGDYGPCAHCGTPLRWWVTTAPATDVSGSVQSSPVLQEPGQPNVDMKWTSSRERDQKMLTHYGMRPVGDKVRGARTEYSPLGARSFHFGQAKTPHRTERGKP